MIQSLTQWIMESLRAHGALSVFIGVLIESIILPIPSPLIIMGAGTLLVDPDLSAGQALGPILAQIVLPGSVASTLGAYFGYGIGFWGGKPLIVRMQGYLGFSWQEVEGMESRFKAGHAGPVIAGLRALPIVPLSLVSIALGVVRWPAGSFTLWTFLGAVPRCLLLGYLGWLTRDAYERLAFRVNWWEGAVSAAIVLGAFAAIFWLRARFKRASRTQRS